jgi:hypothetical protein
MISAGAAANSPLTAGSSTSLPSRSACGETFSSYLSPTATTGKVDGADIAARAPLGAPGMSLVCAGPDNDEV